MPAFPRSALAVTALTLAASHPLSALPASAGGALVAAGPAVTPAATPAISRGSSERSVATRPPGTDPDEPSPPGTHRLDRDDHERGRGRDRGAPAAQSTTRPGAQPSTQPTTDQDGLRRVTVRVYLELQRPQEAADYALAVSTPGTNRHRKYLTPAQFTARFGPTHRQVKEVRNWLTRQGLDVLGVAPNRKYIEATGTQSEASTAFHTRFVRYSDGGQVKHTNVSSPAVPDALPYVQAVVGLDDALRPTVPRARPRVAAGARDAQPCSRYWGEKTVQTTVTPDGTALPKGADDPSAFAPCGYTPTQLRQAYGVESGRGHGRVSVGVLGVGASPTLQEDVRAWTRAHGLPHRPIRQLIDDPRPGETTMDPRELEQWTVEQTMDVEAVVGMATGADVTYFGARDSGTALDALLNEIVARNQVDILTNSYSYPGEIVPSSTMAAIRDIHVQAAAQGMTLLYASGDGGDETYGSGDATAATPNWPASSPFVLAVGGTSLGIDADGRRVFELGWETGMSGLGSGLWSNPMYVFGSGGGASRTFAQPSYQRGVVPDRMATADGRRAAPMRTTPDVALVGDPSTGMMVGQTLRWGDGSSGFGQFRAGGTSLASPLYAGILAVAAQRSGGRIGLVNPVLYTMESRDIAPPTAPEPPGLVRVDYSNGNDGSGGYMYTAWTFDHHAPLTISTQPGYDDVTGLGTPNGPSWLSTLVRRLRG